MSDEPAEPASGLEESRRFYADVVAPALRRRWVPDDLWRYVLTDPGRRLAAVTAVVHP